MKIKSAITLLISVPVFCFFTGPLFADYQDANILNPDYKKTFSIGISAPGLIFTGPIIEAGYEGLGPVGLYGSFGYSSYGVSIGALEDKSDTSIYGLGGGVALKYYYNYKKKYHDSGYFGVQCYYSHLNAQDTSGNVLKSHGLFGHFLFGWRWQWSLVYIDLNIGVGYGHYFKQDASGAFDATSKKKINDNVNQWYSGITTGNIVVGVAF